MWISSSNAALRRTFNTKMYVSNTYVYRIRIGMHIDTGRVPTCLFITDANRKHFS